MRSLLILLGFALVPLLAHSAPEYPDKAKLLVWKDDAGKDNPIAAKEEWAKRRAHILANMEAVMGTLPGKRRINVVYLDEVKGDTFTRKKLTFRPEGYEPVTAYLFPAHGQRAGCSVPARNEWHGRRQGTGGTRRQAESSLCSASRRARLRHVGSGLSQLRRVRLRLQEGPVSERVDESDLE